MESERGRHRQEMPQIKRKSTHYYKNINVFNKHLNSFFKSVEHGAILRQKLIQPIKGRENVTERTTNTPRLNTYQHAATLQPN